MTTFGAGFGQSSLFGQQPQTQTGISAFGQTTNTFGQPQQQTSGLFGAATQNTSGFGGSSSFGQPQTGWGMPSQSSFGGATSSFGQNASSGFKSASTGFGGQQTQQTSGLWGPPTQSNSAFGQQPQQTLSGFGQPTTQGFGQNTQQSSFMPQSQSAFQNLSSANKSNFGGNLGNTPQEVQTASKSLYSEQQYYAPQIKSNGRNFQPKSKMIENNAMIFNNIRSEPEFDRVSSQMIRLLDNLNVPNYEYTAFQEYQNSKYQNPPKYAPHLQQQLSQIELGGGGQTNQTQGARQVTQNQGGFSSGGFGQSSGLNQQWGGQQSSNFGQVSAGVQSLWGGQQQQQPQQQPGSLMQGQGQPVGGGIFGQTSQQSIGLGGLQVSGGLQRQDAGLGFGQIGQQQQQNSGGLFAKPASLQQTPGGTGLFGQQQQPQQIGSGSLGLFGQQQQPQQQLGTGLFGQQNQPQAQPGLLGNTTAQGSGLFGNKSPQQPSTGLFGQPGASGGLGLGQQAQTPQGGLFGTPQVNVSVGLGGGQGLFGQQQAQQQPSGGLFGQQKSGGLFNQQTQQDGGLFKSTQQTATGLFGQVGAQPIGGLFQSQGQGQLLGQNQQTQAQQQVQDPNQILYDLYSTKDPLGLANSFIAKDHPMDITNKEIDELKKSIESKFKSTEKASLNNSALDKVVDQLSDPNFDDQVYLLQDHINLQRSASSVYYEEEVERRRAKEAIKLENLQKNQLQARQNLMNNIPPNKLYRKDLFAPVQQQIVSKPDLSRSKEESLAAPASNSLIKERHTLKITLNFSFKGQTFENSFEIHKTRGTKDVIKEIMRWLFTEFKFDGDASEVTIENQGQPLTTNVPLENANIRSDTTLVVRIPGKESKNNLENSGKILESQLVLQDKTAPKELQPTQPKIGYKCSPAFEKFAQMTTTELENIENFTISNQFGSVKFIGKTDLTRVDLQDIVTIQQNCCEVYDDDKWQNNKPAVGQKLNKPAIITLNNIKPRVNQLPVQKEKSLKENLEKKGDAEHISYDDKNFTWIFKVQHFTKWGDDNEEMEDQDNNQDNAVNQQVEVSGGMQFERSAFEEQSEVEDSGLNNTSQKILKKDENVRFSLFQQKEKQAAPSIFMTQSINFNTVTQPKNIKMGEDLGEPIQKISGQRDQNLNVHNILKKIKQRNEVFSKINPLHTKVLSNEQTEQKLKEMLQLQKLSIAKTSLPRKGIPRPCFHPSGNGILFTQGNIISLKSLPEIKSFGLLPVLKQTVIFQDNDSVIENQMQNLHISSQADVLMENFDSSLSKTEFTDEFFRKMLEKPLLESKLLTKPGDLHNFLLKTAKFYVEKADLRVQKLNEEFFVICMLNALFGNPNVHLCQLHPSFIGPKNIERTSLIQTKEFNDSLIITVKKRRNAVTEVLRLMCHINFPAQIPLQQSDQVIYQTALQLLENCDLRGAVKFLNRNGKTKLSLLVSQSKSNTAAMHLVRQMTQQQGFGNQFNANLKSVFDLVTGQNQKSQNWEKNLLSALLYKKCHSESLKTMIQQLQPENKNVDSLVWKILLVYSRFKDSEQLLCLMNGKQLLREHDSADFKIRWLCCLIMKTALLDHQKQASDNDWNPFIPDYVLTHFSSKYIQQLLRSKQPVEACYVASLIPQSKIRKRALFEIKLRWKEGLDQRHMQLEEYANCSAALYLQNSSQTSKAVDKWLNIGNAEQAEYLLSKDYLPLKIRYESDFSQLIDYHRQQQVFRQPNVFTPIQNQPNYEFQMNKVQSKLGESWNHSICGVYMRTKNLEKSVRKDQPAYTNILAELEKINQDLQMLDQNSNILHWIRTQLTDIAGVIRQRQPNLSQDIVLIQDVPIDQAKRSLIGVLMESYVKVK